MEMTGEKQTKKRGLLAALLCAVLLFAGAVSFFAARWYRATYGDVGFDAILYTLLAGVEGAEAGLMGSFVRRALLPALAVTALLALFFFPPVKRGLALCIRGRKVYPLPRAGSVLCSVILSAALLLTAAARVDLPGYVAYRSATSTIFEERYVDPAQATITFPEKKQNLIYIYLESVETTFLPQELGGGSQVDVLPGLYALARENVNFSHNSGVGGFSSLAGSTWTIGAMVAATAGVPLKVPPGIGINDYGEGSFLPGLVTLSDVLHDNGYYQALMVGSPAVFGGRRQYYEQHGTDCIYDIDTARQEVVPWDYVVWWGMEDLHLFEYAKRVLPEMARAEQPFAFTMLTVDTHHVGGYICQLCGEEYDEQYENVLACSDRQVSQFVDWLKQQDFYGDTTVIIAGDHPTMDNDYVTRRLAPDVPRTVYNCFLNPRARTDNTKNRVFCSLDMFPTTLAAMGCTIEGDRLGLGTDLFSSTPTLCEELGRDAFEAEQAKQSDYYTRNFFFP